MVLLILIILVIPSVAKAVTLDGGATGADVISPLTFSSNSVTSSGGNRAGFLGCSVRNLSNVLTATFGGVSMTEIRRDQASGIPNNQATFLFQLAGIPTGVSTISVSQTGSAAPIICRFESYTNVDQVTMTTDNQGQCVSSTSSSLTLTTASNEMLFDVIGISGVSKALVYGADQTGLITQPSEQGGTHTGGASSQAGSNGGVMSESWTGAQAACQSAISIKHSTFVAPTSRHRSPIFFE